MVAVLGRRHAAEGVVRSVLVVELPDGLVRVLELGDQALVHTSSPQVRLNPSM